jgi:DNA-directed RNA polymerase specialized sigma24 family protein
MEEQPASLDRRLNYVPDPLKLVKGNYPSPLELLEQEQQQKKQQKIIQKAIDSLPERQRQSIECFLYGSNQADTAKKISPEAVSQAKKRALRNLYVILSQYFPERVLYERIRALGLGHLRPIITSKCH